MERERTIGMEELTRKATELIYGVLLRGDRYIISRYGKPAAALVQLSDLEGLPPSGRRLGAMMEEAASAAGPVDEAELAQAVEVAIADIRAGRTEPGD